MNMIDWKFVIKFGNSSSVLSVQLLFTTTSSHVNFSGIRQFAIVSKVILKRSLLFQVHMIKDKSIYLAI